MDQKQRAKAKLARVVALKDQVCAKIVKLEKENEETKARIKELGKADPRTRSLCGLRDLEKEELKELRVVRDEYMAELKSMLKLFQKEEGPIGRLPSDVVLRMPCWRSKVSNKAIAIPRPEV